MPQPIRSNGASRRRFLTTSALASAAIALKPLGDTLSAQTPSRALSGDRPLAVHIFSKHLQFLDYADMAKAAAEIGFDGVDLTVRPEGHVLPENVEQDLPRAVAAVRDAGLKAEMITTAVDHSADPFDRAVLETAADQRIRFYRMNWFRYPKAMPLPEALDGFQQQVAALGELNEVLGLVGAYQNHAGMFVGASLWEVWMLLQSADPESFGIQYDIRHATVESGLSWENGLRLARPHIKTIVAKDFKWVEKDGRNQVVNTPIGEGTVDFIRYFRYLKEHDIHVPVSLHLEYDLGGAQWGQRDIKMPPQKVYEAMRKDLEALRRLWKQA